MTPEKREKLHLKRTPDTTAGQGFNASEGDPHPRGSSSARVALDQIRQGQMVVEPQEFDLPDRDLDFVNRRAGGEIEDRPRHRRHRNPCVNRRLVARQDYAMASDELRGSALARNRHMNRAAPHSPNAPERRSRSVAEHRTDAGRQHRCHRSTERRKAPLTDCVDPRHHDPQAPDRKPVVDRVLPQPQARQLPPCNDPVLRLRHPSNRPIRPLLLRLRARPHRTANIAALCGLAGHGTTVSPVTSRVARAVTKMCDASVSERAGLRTRRALHGGL
jgi:hypothetical protein